MYSQDQTVNWITVGFEVNEAIDAVHSAREFVQSDEFDDDGDMALSVCLCHVLDHLCLAWNRKTMGADERMEQSQEQYEEMTFNIPNWTGRFRLVGLKELETGPRDIEMPLNRDAISHYLTLGEKELQELSDSMDPEPVDSGSLTRLEQGLAIVLQRICLAWHVQYMSVVEVEQMESDAESELASIVPWRDFGYRLIV